MNLKKLDVPDIVPAFAGKFRKILTARIPVGKAGEVVNFISRNRLLQATNEIARMDAVSGVKFLSKKFLEYGHVQIATRPRARLAVFVVALLTTALIGTSLAVEELRSKKNEIKINGQLVFVAEHYTPGDEEKQIDSQISYKENPLDYKMPVKGYISQGYRSYHRAVDIATGRTGVPIVALGTGKVEFAGFLTGGKGNVVIVDHGDGLKSLYAHMGDIKVAVGNEVDSNIALGTVGLTGRTTGAHVHLEVYDNGIMIDPVKVLPNDGEPKGPASREEVYDPH